MKRLSRDACSQLTDVIVQASIIDGCRDILIQLFVTSVIADLLSLVVMSYRCCTACIGYVANSAIDGFTVVGFPITSPVTDFPGIMQS